MIINYFTIGDSKNIEVWSNVPYFIAKKLEEKGIILNRINLEPNNFFQLIYKLVWGGWTNRIIFRIFKLKKNNSYQKSLLNYYLTRLKILFYTHKYNNADFNFFLTFQFSSNKLGKKPYILLYDATYEQYALQNDVIIPNNLKFIIRREKDNIQGAAFVYSTSVHSVNFIRSKYRKDNIHLIKGYLNLEAEELDEKKILNIKKMSNSILFIGGWVGRGGDLLLEIFKKINEKANNKFKLIIVGYDNLDSEYISTNNIEVYNYLSKKNQKELAKYKSLLYEAKLFVMPMRRGPIPAVFIEANYYYIPVITTNIWNAEQMIENGTNGFLIEKLDVKLFVEKILELIKNEEKYITLAANSHKYAAENFRWEMFIDNFVDECKNHLLTGGN